MKKQKRFSLAFLTSLALHLVLAGILWLRPNGLPIQPQHDQQPIEVELLDVETALEAISRKKVEPEKKAQIVEQDEKPVNDETPEEARFLSRHNQKVHQETQAKLHGKFKNTDKTGGEDSAEEKVGKENPKDPGQDRKIPQQDAESESHLLTSSDGIGIKTKPKLKDLLPDFKPGPARVESQDLAEGGGEGPSATDDHLKNVATGMQTLLSTREFVYYSYYNRIKAKLRQYWEPKIKEKMERILRQGRQIASNSDRITRIVIILDQEGTLVRIQVIGPSGVHDLDEAAIEAFKAAAPFPNPPKGIVEEDGTIRIRWDFILEANANGLLEAVRMAHRKE